MKKAEKLLSNLQKLRDKRNALDEQIKNTEDKLIDELKSVALPATSPAQKPSSGKAKEEPKLKKPGRKPSFKK